MADSWSMGIDPGVSGGAALLDVNGEVVDVITFKKYTDRDLADWFEEWAPSPNLNYQVKAVIEKVHSMPKQGVASTFKFGRSFGFLEACLVCNRVQYELVTPQKWQKVMDCRTGGDKNVTKAAAQRRWPDRKITHAIADALLIAEYCRTLKG